MNSLRIGQRRGFSRTIAGVRLDLVAGNAAMQAAIAANSIEEDRRAERHRQAQRRCVAAWVRLGLTVAQVRVRVDRKARKTWCVVQTDQRGERTVWSGAGVEVETLEDLAAWWSQQEVIP